MAEQPRRGGYLREAWLVIVLALVFGGALAGVEMGLSGKIAENKRQETYRVIPDLVPGADASRTVEVLMEGEDGKEARVYRVLGVDGTHKGWVVPAQGQGFADRIELLIGIDASATTVTGLYVLDQKETPGLGDQITGEEFRDRFRGRSADVTLMVVKGEAEGGSEVTALTGATISSESVAVIVNDALANLRRPIRGRVGARSGGTGRVGTGGVRR